MDIPGITIFFPCYNDKYSIKNLVENAFKTVSDLTNNYEVLVINDGSTDGSGIVLAKLAEKYKHLKVITHKKNLGYGAALRTGFKKASKSLVFYTDGDGQYDVSELPILFNLMTKDTDFVNGIKMSRHDPTYRIFMGNLYSFLVRWLFWIPTYDVDCDFRLIRKSVIDKIDLKNNSGAICVELVKKAERAGAIFRQVSVHHLERKHGSSQFFRIDKILPTLLELAKTWVSLMVLKEK